jgi:hypothetical protein
VQLAAELLPLAPAGITVELSSSCRWNVASKTVFYVRRLRFWLRANRHQQIRQLGPTSPQLQLGSLAIHLRATRSILLALSSESLGSVFVARVFLAGGRDKAKIEENFAFLPPDRQAEFLRFHLEPTGFEPVTSSMPLRRSTN